MTLHPVPSPAQAALRPWFLPERPGPLVGLHVINTGHGTLWVDRIAAPRLVKAAVAGNICLLGDPSLLAAVLLPEPLTGFLDAADSFVPRLQALFPRLQWWYRLIFEQTALPAAHPAPSGAVVRRLGAADAAAVAGLDDEIAWIHKTWGGPAGLAAGGHAWGAFVAGRLAAVACSFFVGDAYEDLGVVTVRAHRRRGLSTACAAALCADVRGRGRLPSWTTAVENEASIRVADKLGFVLQRQDRLLVVNRPLPAS